MDLIGDTDVAVTIPAGIAPGTRDTERMLRDPTMAEGTATRRPKRVGSVLGRLREIRNPL